MHVLPTLFPFTFCPPFSPPSLPPSPPPSLPPLLDFLDRMGVWILDGVVWHSQLLPFVLKKDLLRHTMVMIVVDLSQPWNVMESLERWAEVVQKHINSLQVPPQDLKEMEENSETLGSMIMHCTLELLQILYYCLKLVAQSVDH